jgi:IS1 family transposase
VGVPYRAVDQYGQVIDVYASTQRDTEAARRFFQRAKKATGVVPAEVITDRAPTYPRVLDRLWPAAWHHVERYANNRIESDHAQLKRWLRAMCGIKTMIGLRILAAGHALVQNLRRGHYEIAADQPTRTRLAAAFIQLATAISGALPKDQHLRPARQRANATGRQPVVGVVVAIPRIPPQLVQPVASNTGSGTGAARIPRSRPRTRKVETRMPAKAMSAPAQNAA